LLSQLLIGAFVEPMTDLELPPLPSMTVGQSFARVAVLSDVHGNLPALVAVLREVSQSDVEALFFLGDHTWGPQPAEVLAQAMTVPLPTFFVRGNAERALIEYEAGHREPENDIDRWMIANHDSDVMQTLAAFPYAINVSVGALGAIKMCHGSPRSDIELLTPRTSINRLHAAVGGISESTVAHGHTHLQYERRIKGLVIAAPGSVGLPYGVTQPGARWAILGNEVELRTTRYDFAASISAARNLSYPGIARYEMQLRNPPSIREIEKDAERRLFAD
jgi:predicted phosphodiesterase